MFQFNKDMLKVNRNAVILAIAVVAIGATAALIIARPALGNASSFFKFSLPSSKEAVAKKTVDYINQNNLAGLGQTATLEGVSEESGNIKVKIKIGSNTFDSYVSKDGKFLFPQAINLDEKPQPNPVPANQPTK